MLLLPPVFDTLRVPVLAAVVACNFAAAGSSIWTTYLTESYKRVTGTSFGEPLPIGAVDLIFKPGSTTGWQPLGWDKAACYDSRTHTVQPNSQYCYFNYTNPACT
jgi:hypothetical protein